jgi:aryl-alcohol dehydrogenase (NADP+)
MKMARRDDIVISTKAGARFSPGHNDQGTGRKHLMAAVDDQLKRLQTDYIDVYQVHRLDPHTPIEETMYTLDQIVKSGKVRYIGGSTMPAYKFAQMIMTADHRGYARPIAMQNLYNLIQREEEREMNQLCQEQGVGLIPYSPLARGFLAGNRSKEGGGATERARNDANVAAGTYRDCDWEVVDRLKKIALGKNCTPAQAALAWMIAKPYMAAPIIGATDLEQLSSAAKATDFTITAEDVRTLEEPYQFRVSPAA